MKRKSPKHKIVEEPLMNILLRFLKELKHMDSAYGVITIPEIVDKFKEKGFKFDSASGHVKFLDDKKSRKFSEVDGLLENEKFVIAVETKPELKVEDVNIHIKHLQALRKLSRFKGRKIYGALSTIISKNRPINYALKQGLYVLHQPDKVAVKIADFPKGCSAKAW